MIGAMEIVDSSHFFSLCDKPGRRLTFDLLLFLRIGSSCQIINYYLLEFAEHLIIIFDE